MIFFSYILLFMSTTTVNDIVETIVQLEVYFKFLNILFNCKVFMTK